MTPLIAQDSGPKRPSSQYDFPLISRLATNITHFLRNPGHAIRARMGTPFSSLRPFGYSTQSVMVLPPPIVWFSCGVPAGMPPASHGHDRIRSGLREKRLSACTLAVFHIRARSLISFRGHSKVVANPRSGELRHGLPSMPYSQPGFGSSLFAL